MRTRLRSKFSLLFLAFALMLAMPVVAALAQDTGTSPAPTIQSDKDDYAPGELVTLTGGNWQPGESVNIKVNDDVGQTWNRNVNVTADASGNITDSFNLPDWFVATYSVTATGSSGTATTSFTDARVVTSATLNDGSSVNVTPGGSITAKVTVQRDGSGANARWESTGWFIGTTAPSSFNCVDHTDYNAAGTDTETFSVTAPSTLGTYNAYFKAYNDDNCSNASGANAPSVTFTLSNGVVVQKAAQATLTLNAPASMTFGDPAATLTTDGGSGTGAVSYDVGTSTGCEVNGDKLTVTNASGTCSVTATKAGDSNYNSTTSAAKTVTLNKAAQATLTLNAPASMTFGDPAATLTTTGGSGDGNVTYSAGTSNGCEVNGDQLTVTNASGTCSVTATKAGNDNYNSTTSAAKSVTLVKANQAALNYTGPTTGTYLDKLTLSSSGGSGTGAVTYEVTGTACELGTGADAGKLLITSGTGTCSVEVKKASDNNYNAASSGVQTITVNKANQAALTVTSPGSGTYGEHLEITTSGGSGTGALSFQATGTACQIDANNKLEITSGTGTCSVTATKAADDNYKSTFSPAFVVTVQKAAQATLTLNAPASMTYNDPAATLTTTGGNGTGAVSYDVGTSTGCEVNGDQLTVTNASGTCSVTATKASDDNYLSKTSAAKSVTLLKANQAALTLNAPASMTFGDPAATLTTTGGSGTGAVSYDVGTSTGCAIANGDKLSVTNASGTCSVTATKAGDNNYNSKTDSKTVALVKANQAALNYTGPTTGTYLDKLTLSSSGGSGTGAVTYEVTGTACELGTGADAGKLLITSGTGTCSVEVKKASDNNYNAASSGVQTITVNKANQTINFTALSGNRIVGETFQVSATATSGLSVSFSLSGPCTISSNNVSVTGPGTCTITAKQAGNGNYNAATDVSQNVNVSYQFVGWNQPVDGNGLANSVVNMGKVGRTYPIKWQLKEHVNGSLQLISDSNAQGLVSSMSGVARKADCTSFVGSDALEEYTAGATELRYDATSDQFIYNYKAPSSPACQAFVVSKADGFNSKQANFNFTK